MWRNTLSAQRVAYLFGLLAIISLPVCTSSAFGLELKLSLAGHERMRLGEPVVVLLILRNDTGSPVRVPARELIPEFGHLTLWIRDPGGAEREFRPPVRYEGSGERFELPPGRFVFDFAKIFHGARGPVMRAPGEYGLRGVWEFAGATVKSNGLRFYVAQPEGEWEMEQAKLLLAPEASLFLYFEGGDHLKVGRGFLEKVTQIRWNSTLAAYAWYGLGTSLSTDFYDYTQGKLRPANAQRSVELLTKAKSLSLSPFYRKQTFTTLVSLYAKMGRKDLAVDAARSYMSFTGVLHEPEKGLFEKAFATETGQIVPEVFKK